MITEFLRCNIAFSVDNKKKEEEKKNSWGNCFEIEAIVGDGRNRKFYYVGIKVLIGDIRWCVEQIDKKKWMVILFIGFGKNSLYKPFFE